MISKAKLVVYHTSIKYEGIYTRMKALMECG